MTTYAHDLMHVRAFVSNRSRCSCARRFVRAVDLDNQVKLLTVRLSTTEEFGADRNAQKGEKLDKTKEQARKLEKRLQELTDEHEQLASTLERERKTMRKDKDQMQAQLDEMRTAWDKDLASKEVIYRKMSVLF